MSRGTTTRPMGRGRVVGIEMDSCCNSLQVEFLMWVVTTNVTIRG